MFQHRSCASPAAGSAEARRRSGSTTASPRKDPRAEHAGPLMLGSHIQCFSFTANSWVEAEVVDFPEVNVVQLVYPVRDFWCTKKVHVHSDHIDIATTSTPGRIGPGRPPPRQKPAGVAAAAAIAPNSLTAERTAENCQFHGCRRGLPTDDPVKYYIEMDYIWELLEKGDVVLIRGKWLWSQSRKACRRAFTRLVAEGAEEFTRFRELSSNEVDRVVSDNFSPLPSRRDLPPEAIVDVEVLKQAAIQTPNQMVIVAISHCWLSPDHPDPRGDLLEELAPVIEAYLNSSETSGWKNLQFDGAFFLAWCSLHQPYHEKSDHGQYRRLESPQLTPAEKDKHSSALENMDIWYTHQRTEKWLLTMYFDGQGNSYAERGWPTWESTVAGLLTGGGAVIDVGAVGSLSGQDLIETDDMDEIREACTLSRKPPMHPKDFDKLIDGKYFTCGDTDRRLVKSNYRRNFSDVMCCVETLEFADICINCTDGELESFFMCLRYCQNLLRLELQRNQLSCVNTCNLAKSLRYCSKLRCLNLSVNQIGNDGASELGEHIGHCSELEKLCLRENQIGNDGALMLACGVQRCSKLKFLFLHKNQIADAGVFGLAHGLQHCLQLKELNLSNNQVSDDGALVLVEALQRCNELEILRLYGNCISDTGAITIEGHLQQFSQLKPGNLNPAEVNVLGLDFDAAALDSFLWDYYE